MHKNILLGGFLTKWQAVKVSQKLKTFEKLFFMMFYNYNKVKFIRYKNMSDKIAGEAYNEIEFIKKNNSYSSILNNSSLTRTWNYINHDIY